MAQFIPAKDDWAKAFQQIGSGVSEGFTNRADENAIRKAVEGLGPQASMKDILNTVAAVKTYSPESKQRAFQQFAKSHDIDLEGQKFQEMKRHAQEQDSVNKARSEIDKAKEAREAAKPQEDRAKVKSIVNQLDVPDEQKQSLGESLSLGAAEGLLKDQLKPKKDNNLSPFQKKVQEKNAEEYINLNKDIPKLETTLDDIAYARKLSDELGLIGSAAGAVNLSGKAKELEGVSFTLMEPIVKIFNPSGPIAQQKLKTIQEKYVINPSDAPWTKKAKLDALERFAKQALNRAQQKLSLIKKHEGNPPESEIDRFDKESNTISDAMIDYDLIGEEVKDEGMPPAKDFPKKTVTSPDGQKYYSDGTKWVKK